MLAKLRAMAVRAFSIAMRRSVEPVGTDHPADATLDGAKARATSNVASAILLVSFFWIIAAASHSGFMGKWAFLDNYSVAGRTVSSHDNKPYVSPASLERMLDGTADSPFAYRRLGPILANSFEFSIPNKAKGWLRTHVAAKLSPAKVFSRAGTADRPEFQLRYMFLYYASFSSLLISLFVLRQILLDLRLDNIAATVAPAIFLLALPYIQTFGGYFYDNFELLFLSLSLLLVLRGKLIALLLLVPIATLNKESFLFFIPTLYPLLVSSKGKQKAFWTLGASLFVSGFVNLVVKYFYSNGGSVAQLHFLENLYFYLNPANYFLLEITYGIVAPAALFFATAIVTAAILVRGWPTCPERIKKHMIMAAAINLPLFFIFCKGGELRNLSLMFVSFVVLIGCTLQKNLATGATRHGRNHSL